MPPGRITLKGPGVTRALTPVELKDERALARGFTGDKDFAAGPLFQFHGLAAGSYEISIEAPGYPPANMTVEVTPGKVAQAQIALTAPAKP